MSMNVFDQLGKTFEVRTKYETYETSAYWVECVLDPVFHNLM